MGAEIGYDEMVGRASATSSKFSLTMGNADAGPGLATVVIDGASNSFVFSKAGQPTRTYSFTMVAQQKFPGNAAMQAEFIATMDDLATDRTLMTSFESYSYRSGVSFNDDPVVEYQCAFIPCRRIVTPGSYPDEWHWRSTLVPDWDYLTGPNTNPDDDYPGYTEAEVRADRERFERRRQEACEEADLASQEGAFSMVVTGGTCLYADTLPGALACVGAAGNTFFASRRSDRLYKQCKAVYPGPGAW